MRVSYALKHKRWIKMPNTYKTRLRLLMVIVVSTILLGVYFYTMSFVNNRNENNLFKSRLVNKKSILESNIKVSSNRTYGFANEFTYWDDMVNFVHANASDLSFATNDINPALGTYGADTAWVFNLNKQLIYSVSDNEKYLKGLDVKKVLPISPDQFPVLFAHNGIYNYFINTTAGVFEIDAATIHPSNDPGRKTPTQGYFFVGRLLGPDYLNELGKLVEGTARIQTSSEQVKTFKDSYSIKTTSVTVGKPLLDSMGRPIAILSATYIAHDLRDAYASSDRLNHITFIVFMIIIIGSTLFQIRTLFIPMSLVQEALASGNATPIAKLKDRNDEFGSISKLIVLSFQQQELLKNQKLMVEKEVTDRTELLRNEEKTLKTLIDSLPVGVFMVHAPGGEPALINEMGIKILGRNLDNSVDKTKYSDFYDVIKDDGSRYPPQDLPLGITLATKKPAFKNDIVVARPDTSRAYLRVVSAPIIYEDGSMPYAVTIFEDITNEKETERSRDEFFSIASHELRTPLTAIRGNTSLIQQYFKPALKDPELKGMVDDIHESSIRLIEIVNDFLDTSRLEQKRVKYDFAKIDMAEIAESAIKEYRVTGSRRMIHLEVQKPSDLSPKVWADSDRAKQILINLVGNALKFTESGSVVISFKLEDNWVKTLVADTGQGMDEAAQNKLFRKFEQTGSKVLTRDSVRGTGLGLYISKMLVEQMNGSMKLEHSEMGKGTTFSFSLPIDPPRQIDPSTLGQASV